MVVQYVGMEQYQHAQLFKTVRFQQFSISSELFPSLQLPLLTLFSIYYYSIVMTLFRFLKAPIGSDEASMATASHARCICIQSAYHVTELINKHRLHWRLRRMTPSCLQWISISLFSLLDDLHNTTSCAAFVTLCAAIRSSSNCCILAKEVLLRVHSSASKAGIKLPQESGALFDDFQGY